MMHSLTRILAAALFLSCGAAVAGAADAGAAGAETSSADVAHVDAVRSERLLGVLPNYMTVDAARVAIQTTHDAFKAASLSTFDPFVYPFVGATTMFGSGHDDSYTVRYSRALADNALGNFMTSAIVPSLTNEDSRYYRRGSGGALGRVMYAASRSVVTRTRSGASTFNVSEIGGTAIAAGLSNTYYSPADRTAGATATRWGTQIMWDTLANELKEFWPDVSAKLHKH
jgi:hypothetical protein